MELRKKYDIVVMAAAVSDYAPVPRRSKAPSGRAELAVRMRPLPKIIDSVKKARPGVFLVGFKAESGVSRAVLEKRARRKMRECGADIVVANDVERVCGERTDAVMVGEGWTRKAGRTKASAARAIVREIGARLR